jgi:hypothetical protein
MTSELSLGAQPSQHRRILDSGLDSPRERQTVTIPGQEQTLAYALLRIACSVWSAMYARTTAGISQVGHSEAPGERVSARELMLWCRNVATAFLG